MDQQDMQAKMQAAKAGGKVKFYSRFLGTRYAVQKGAVVETFEFHPEGDYSVLETDDREAIAQIRDAIRTGDGSVLSLTPVVVKKSDAFIMREVGKKTGAAAASSSTLAALAALSNG